MAPHLEISLQCVEEKQSTDASEQIAQELKHYRNLSHQLSRRVRLIMAYNKAQIDKRTEFEQREEVLNDPFECLCGAKQVESLKYELIHHFDDKYNQFLKSALQIEENRQENHDNHLLPNHATNNAPVLFDQQPADQPEVVALEANESCKELVKAWAEEKAQLQQQIEELKLQSKLPEEQIYQSSLFAELVQQNNQLTANLFSLEEQLFQVPLQPYSSQAQLQAQELSEKHLHSLQQIQSECNLRIKEICESLPPQRTEIVIQEEGSGSLIESLRVQTKSLEKAIDDMKNELQKQRERNSELQNALTEEANLKQQQIIAINELKQTLSVGNILNQQEKIQDITLRYDKHKSLLYEIEQEYINKQNQDQINKFREFVGYVKMRDEKVKGLEQLIDTKQQDYNTLKNQIQSILDELDYNAQSYASQIENNKTLSKLLDETQKNESRAMKAKTLEKAQFEAERSQLLQKIASLEEQMKLLQQQQDNFRKLQMMIEQERTSSKETIRQLQRQDAENKQKLVQKENELTLRSQELKIFYDREKLSDSINSKYIKLAEKSKAKQKVLKLQLKMDSKERNDELIDKMKLMINCQQCKNKIKSVILVKCLHMFCKPCIDDNQKNRNRACPICRARYSGEEVKQIKLE